MTISLELIVGFDVDMQIGPAQYRPVLFGPIMFVLWVWAGPNSFSFINLSFLSLCYTICVSRLWE